VHIESVPQGLAAWHRALVDLAAGGVHCGRREKLPAGGTATPLPGTGEHVMNQLFHSKAALNLTRNSSAQHVQAAELPQQSVHCPCSLSSAGSPDIPPSSAEYKVSKR